MCRSRTTNTVATSSYPHPLPTRSGVLWYIRGMITDKNWLVQEFEKITVEMLQTMVKKNNDYSDGDDPFKNFMMVERLNIATVEQGFLTRMSDKLSRLATFAKGKEFMVADEKVDDTCKDLANYSILLLCYLRSKK